MYDKKQEIREGIMAAIPLIVGFIPVAMTFGILSKTCGLSMLESFLFSSIVVAGSSQFMALNLLVMGAGLGEIIFTTFLINLRHFLMSASLSTRITPQMRKYIPIIAFVVTDETFSVASFREKELTTEYMLPFQLLAYSSWSLGTLLGYLVGSVLPQVLRDSMGIAIYAMFIAILVPQIRQNIKVLILALSAGAMHTILNYTNIFSKGWSLILSIVVIALCGAYFFKDENEKRDKDIKSDDKEVTCYE